MSPYVELQKHLIRWLRALQSSNPKLLSAVIQTCDSATQTKWSDYLRALGFSLIDEDWHKEHNLSEMILEQILEPSRGKITIRGVLGFPLHNDRTCTSLEEWVAGSFARMRTERFAHVGALAKGDLLISGDLVISPPRDGGNGSVLLQVARSAQAIDQGGDWLEYPGRTVLALIGSHEGPVPKKFLDILKL